jgi:type IV pilus biogenesis protein CpaD/CtpE
MRRLLPGILLVAVATSLAGCNSDNNTTVTTPTTTTTTTPTVTETFTGTLNMNGGATFPFTATAAGTVTLTLTSLSGDATLPVGLSLGTWTGSACQIVIANDAAAQTAVVTGTVTSAASLCARVYDTGKVATPVDFTVTIAHP